MKYELYHRGKLLAICATELEMWERQQHYGRLFSPVEVRRV